MKLILAIYWKLTEQKGLVNKNGIDRQKWRRLFTKRKLASGRRDVMSLLFKIFLKLSRHQKLLQIGKLEHLCESEGH